MERLPDLVRPSDDRVVGVEGGGARIVSPSSETFVRSDRTISDNRYTDGDTDASRNLHGRILEWGYQGVFVRLGIAEGGVLRLHENDDDQGSEYGGVEGMRTLGTRKWYGEHVVPGRTGKVDVPNTPFHRRMVKCMG